jgi:cytochrome c biogenesis protein CcdA/thioredoxin-related protein
MKRIVILTLLVFLSFFSYSQNESFLKWNVVYDKIDNQIYQITATAEIPKGWHVYGNNPKVEGLSNIKIITDFENDSLINELSFNKAAETLKDPLFDNQIVNVYTGAIQINQQVKISGTVPNNLVGTIEVFLAKDNDFKQDAYLFKVKLDGGVAPSDNKNRIKISSIDINHPLSDCGDKSTKNNSLWVTFFLGFLGGLVALVTPCVFPMIPVTVSFFTKRSNNKKKAIKNGLLYGFFIFIIYMAASLPFHILGNVQPEVFNQISTNAWVNITFFIVFVVFAISFFGFFEITLPSSIANKADSKSSLGSLGGIFFMALTLAIVSFSCTGPILGTLLVGTAGGGAWQLTSGLAGFGLALALPFGLFAIFPGWLQTLPKSGGWLGTVKKVLAFVELALALKFLSNADLVMHWGILKREIFFAIWIIISAALTLYLFGILRFSEDKKGMKIPTLRKIFAIISLCFTIYLIPGLTNSKYANLNWVSGFPPPLSSSIYGKENIKGKGLEANVINDYNKALQLAKEQNKPLLIDFTGWACVNCRKMEENVWSQKRVYDYIQENFILVSLYVDDKERLPVEKRFTYNTKQGPKEIVTIGDQWATFETENFQKQSQPLYVVVDTKERLITNPVGYTPDVQKYLDWLRCGKETFDNNK